MKLVVASVDCHVEEGLDSFCVSSDSPVRISEWQSFGLVPGRNLERSQLPENYQSSFLRVLERQRRKREEWVVSLTLNAKYVHITIY